LRAFQLWIRINKGWKHWKTIAKIALSDMPQADIDGYQAPYPDKSYLPGHRQFTQMLPTRNNNPILAENYAALQKLKNFQKPFLCLYSDKDQISPKGYHEHANMNPLSSRVDRIFSSKTSRMIMRLRSSSFTKG